MILWVLGCASAPGGFGISGDLLYVFEGCTDQLHVRAGWRLNERCAAESGALRVALEVVDGQLVPTTVASEGAAVTACLQHVEFEALPSKGPVTEGAVCNLGLAWPEVYSGAWKRLEALPGKPAPKTSLFGRLLRW